VSNRQEYLRRKQREAEAKAAQAAEAAAQVAAIEAQAAAELAAASPAVAAIAAAAKAAVADWDRAVQLKVAELQAAAAAASPINTAAASTEEITRGEAQQNGPVRTVCRALSNPAAPVSPSGPLRIGAPATDFLFVQRGVRSVHLCHHCLPSLPVVAAPCIAAASFAPQRNRVPS
jgi:hypothetical protein